MKENQNQNHLENSKKNEKEWVFVAIRKSLIAKRTEDYVLVKLPYGYSAIINGKFIRKKESDDFIYASMPYDYKINTRQTEYDVTTKQWNVVDEKVRFPRQISWTLHVLEEQLKSGQKLEDILAYSNLEVDTDKLPF